MLFVNSNILCRAKSGQDVDIRNHVRTVHIYIYIYIHIENPLANSPVWVHIENPPARRSRNFEFEFEFELTRVQVAATVSGAHCKKHEE